MNKEFEEIIDFAIDHEHKAVKFYQDQQKETKLSEKKTYCRILKIWKKDISKFSIA